MTTATEISSQHKQAATDHQAAAQLHTQAAQAHDQNQMKALLKTTQKCDGVQQYRTKPQNLLAILQPSKY